MPTHFSLIERFAPTGGQSFTERPTLNLSGAITIRHPRIWPRLETSHTFESLTPFTQGYVRALLIELLLSERERPLRLVNYSAIHPPTLARIMKDCERVDDTGETNPMIAARLGALFWIKRSESRLVPWFRPLTPYLTHNRSGARIIFAIPLSAVVGPQPEAAEV
jgi:hypothetical protein